LDEWLRAGQAHHRFPGNFFNIMHSPLQQKSPCSPEGTRTEKILSAVPPCLPEKPTALERCQHTVCPLTLALRQKILWFAPFPPALGGPFAKSLFALLSALQNSLWMRFSFYFRFNGFCN